MFFHLKSGRGAFRSHPVGPALLAAPQPPAPGRPRGFSLLELLVVMALIAALSGVMLGLGRRAGEAGRVARTKAELAALAAALEDYRRILGDYPRTEDGARLLDSLLGRRGPTGGVVAFRTLIDQSHFAVTGSLEPAAEIPAVLVDPWGRAYRYVFRTRSPWDNPNYVLYSVGPDGRDSATWVSGGYPDPLPVENVDNLYANQ